MENKTAPQKPALFDGKRRYFLNMVSPTLLGRQSCAILLTETGIAPQHARFNPTRAGFLVEPVGGEVQVNGALVTSPTLLKPGDAVLVAGISLTYEGPAVSGIPEQKLGYDELFDRVKHAVVGVFTPTGLGSGFYIHSSGLLVTNRHVVGYEREVSIHAADGRQFTGRVVRSFPEIDLAFVRVDPITQPVPPFVPAGMTRVGQAVLVIGHPKGLSNTLTKGIISAVNREVLGNIYLQTDAAINPGNSGGPIFNDLGEIVGVASMGIGQSQGLNFAIPADVVRRWMEVFIKEEAHVQRGKGTYCFVCGNFSVGGAYCPNCGFSFAERKPEEAASPAVKAADKCASCGKPLNPGDVFCPACGTRV